MNSNSNTAAHPFPHIDGREQDSLTDAQAQFFRENGLIVVRNLLHGEELRRLQAETLPLVQRAAQARVDDPDFYYKKHEITGQDVPFRIEYVVDKTTAGKALLGHPFVLRSVEKLQGRNFVPTWDSMVYKLEGAGASIPWHRDTGTDLYGDEQFHAPVFNVDFYLDPADLSNCLWGIPGSNRWTPELAQKTCAALNAGGAFKTDGAIPIQMSPGDVIFHNILVLHGSPPTQTRLRRVVYLEFRPGELERNMGPHAPEYIPPKQKVLLACLRDRAHTAYARGETPFVYRPDPEFMPPPFDTNEQLATYRYPHEKYWRKKELST